ncbi:MAG: uncharacterized protein QG657_187 [Acidobacteriota bacterium]|nr:uncharacterized protein [Acidobacteriota bacterium]
MNSQLRLREIHTIAANKAIIGLGVDDLLLFKMNPAIQSVIDCYPELERLTPYYKSEEIEKAVHLLKSKRLLVPQVAPTPPAPAVSQLYHSIAIYLDHPLHQRPMTEDLLFNIIDLFLSACDFTLPLRIVLCTDFPSKALPMIDCAIQYVKKKHREIRKQITWILRTPAFPAAPEVISVMRKRSIRLNWVPEPPGERTLLDQVQDAFHRWKDVISTNKPGRKWKIDGIVTAAVLPGAAADIPEVVTILKKMGFARLYNDYWCYQCRVYPGENQASPPYYMEIINNHRYPVEEQTHRTPRAPRTGYGFVDYFPIARRLVSSRKNHFGCAAGIYYAAVAPDGAIYACHGVINDPRYHIGAVSTGIDGNKVQGLGIQSVGDRSPCSGCWGRYICGGGSNLKNVSQVNNACAGYLSQVEQVLAEYESFDLNAKNTIRYLAEWTDTLIPHRDTYVDKPVRSLKPRLLTVHGRSMWPLLKNGNKVTVAPVKPGQARFGDIICFDYPPVCHRIIAKFNWHGEPAVLEKGDHTRIGTVIPLREITGKVAAIHKTTKTMSIETPLWRALNGIIASLSLATHAVCGVFLWIRYGGRL